jgi:hypothetical protein
MSIPHSAAQASPTADPRTQLEAEKIGIEKRKVFRDHNEFERTRLQGEYADHSLTVLIAEEELAAARARYQQATKEAKAQQKRTLKALLERGEMIEVECYVIPIEGSRKVRLVTADGEEIATRNMTVEERQLALDLRPSR